MIRIYYTNISGDCSKEQSLAMYGHLPKERQEKIDRLKHDDAKRRKLLSSYFLQQVLSNELQIPMDEIVYQYGNWGKPEIDFSKMKAPKSEDFYFNMSHSGDYAVVAVANTPVGVDIESNTKGFLKVAKRCFLDHEYTYIENGQNNEEQENRFLEVWTKKEAYIKYLGEGLKVPFKSFCVRNQFEDVLAKNPEIPNPEIIDLEKIGLINQEVMVADLSKEKNYKVAVCCKDREYIVKNLQQTTI